MVNHAQGGTLPIEVGEKTADSSLLDLRFQLHRAAPIGALTRPNELPGTFESFGGFGELIGGIVMLDEPPFEVTCLTAIIALSRLALNNIYPDRHTKKVRSNLA